ncbi:GNAT family N-acetyltransferase [Mucilaginibacter dorajii]|uniref:N-acetyltransferase domain-containing protein n=1 Tax=Mucilaginibacter dorajii TaxID=692994 RepID=A0ABP7QXT2_9SPHI|nr:GNAT family N-acetyltransferase [Mucilaginibacter dorajii]MCS3732451.1 ribosomal protein S18 acetylase RimI-like enzyme [Mucilaginibacter dorajii]
MQLKINYAKPDHLDSICKIWGLNRATLGLMPKEAFKDCITKKWILVAEINNQVVGYLQFRYTAKNQTLSIVHLCVDISSRGQGLADKLLDKLVEDFKLKARGIKLSCRSDYAQAISFWTRYNFQPKGKLPSRGNNPNVHLVVWWFSFGGEDLFSIQKNDKIKAVLDFNIIAKLMDMSVSDKVRDEIVQLQSDWLVTEVEYYQTSETTSEIFRDANTLRRDRSRLFLKDFPELNIDKPSIKLVETELLKFFPGSSDNDRSDRRQVAESVLSGFPYFVTLDDGILKQAKEILASYQLKVITPSTLISEIDLSINAEDYYPNKLSGNNFTVGKLRPVDRSEIDEMFLNTGAGEKKSAFGSILNDLVAKPTGCVQVIKEAGKTVAFYGYLDADDSFMVPVIRTKQYSLRQTIFIQNINDLVKLALSKARNFIVVSDPFLTDIEKGILMGSGFFFQDDVYIRGIKSGLYEGAQLPTELSHISTKIPGLKKLIGVINKSTLEALTLEKLLWPLKICDADIPCFIIPIKPYYAKELFDTKAAKSELFGVQPTLIWSKENVYYRNVNPNVEKFPARILWYASSDPKSTRQKGIVCSSYLNEVIVGPAKEVFKKHEKFGVYSWKRDISNLVKGVSDKPIKVLRFSDSESFPNVVQLAKIKQVLARNNESDNNFQSPLRIKSTTFMELYAMGNGLIL